MTTAAPPVRPDDLARLAAHALSLLPDLRGRGPLRLGLGSGRAAEAFVHALAGRVAGGLRVEGVPTSRATATLAERLGIPLGTLGGDPLEATIDGADEVDPRLDLIKGYGGALVRERIVAAASRRQVILVTAEKLVPRLGSRGRLPVEIVPFARPLCERRLQALGCRPSLRGGDARPFVTDNGNWILDCSLDPVDDARPFEGAIRRIPGVVDTGFFLGTADSVVVADPGGLRVLRPAR